MATKWTHTRAALQQMETAKAGKYLTQLMLRGPQILIQARMLAQEYPFTDDRFKIRMIHYLRQTLPGDLEPLYDAMLQDIMEEKPQLHS